jgi:hypothetical protein
MLHTNADRIFEVKNREGCSKFNFKGAWAKCAIAIQTWYDDLEDYDEDEKRIEYKATIDPKDIAGKFMEIGESIRGAYEGADSYEWELMRVA